MTSHRFRAAVVGVHENNIMPSPEKYVTTDLFTLFLEITQSDLSLKVLAVLNCLPPL